MSLTTASRVIPAIAQWEIRCGQAVTLSKHFSFSTNVFADPDDRKGSQEAFFSKGSLGNSKGPTGWPSGSG
jgi:hypothetical protein